MVAFSWSDVYSATLAANEVFQIADGGALTIVKNAGPGNLQVGTITVKSGRFIVSRQNDLTLKAFGPCTVDVQYAAV